MRVVGLERMLKRRRHILTPEEVERNQPDTDSMNPIGGRRRSVFKRLMVRQSAGEGRTVLEAVEGGVPHFHGSHDAADHTTARDEALAVADVQAQKSSEEPEAGSLETLTVLDQSLVRDFTRKLPKKSIRMSDDVRDRYSQEPPVVP